MTKRFMEKNNIKAEVPVDINGAGITGQRVHMEGAFKLSVVIGYASAAADADVTINQHDAAAAGNSKVLPISNSYFTKIDAETAFTQKALAAVSNVVDATFNGVAGMLVLEINAEDLDVNNEFAYISVDLASPGAIARVVSVEYILHDLRSQPGYEQDI